VVDWGGGVCCSCSIAQLRHWLLPINCHFLRLAGRDIASVSSAIEESDLYFFTFNRKDIGLYNPTGMLRGTSSKKVKVKGAILLQERSHAACLSFLGLDALSHWTIELSNAGHFDDRRQSITAC